MYKNDKHSSLSAVVNHNLLFHIVVNAQCTGKKTLQAALLQCLVCSCTSFSMSNDFPSEVLQNRQV